MTITPDAIRAQLAVILSSEIFVRARRMQRFLEYVVEETLAGRADQLGEYAIGIGVFDRGADFEPALDPIVRNDARRLRAKLAEYYRESPADIQIEVPKGGYVPVFRRMAASQLAPRYATSETPLRFVINGHLSKSGDRCRIVVNVIDVAEGAPVWTGEYDFLAGEDMRAVRPLALAAAA